MSNDTQQQRPDDGGDTTTPAKRDWHADAYEIRSPVIVHSRADIAGLLRGHRMAKRMTCLEHDDRAGFHQGYTAKLEHGDKPSGKRGFHIQPESDRLAVSFMAETWLESLDLALVLMPRWQADQIGAQPAPKREAA